MRTSPPFGRHGFRPFAVIAGLFALAFLVFGQRAAGESVRSQELDVVQTARQSANLLIALGQLAVQEGDAPAVRTWGADLERSQTDLLKTLPTLDRADRRSPVSAHDSEALVHDLAQWRSHWFDRRVLASALDVQMHLLSELDSFAADGGTDDEEGVRWAPTVADSLRQQISATSALSIRAGTDPAPAASAMIDVPQEVVSK